MTRGFFHHGAARFFLVAAWVLSAATRALPAGAGDTRLKDMARIAGLESIPLIGYGVVVGLRGTGDKDLALSKQTLANLLESFKITLPVDEAKSKNVACVMVSARVPPFHAAGDRVDVEVSSIGDATSLEGGQLLMTPLLDPNGEVYALAQGSVLIGGYTAGGGEGGGANVVTRNHTTVGAIPGAALLKYGTSNGYLQNGMLRLILRQADFTTASRVAAAINAELGAVAVAADALCVHVQIPDAVLRSGGIAAFVSRLENVRVTPDYVARVIVNERTGTIVIGGEVRIHTAVVAHGNLTVTVKETQAVSQPRDLTLVGPQPGIRTEVTREQTTTVEEERARVVVMPATPTVRDVADTLNQLGATPRDLISILQALHRLGALPMEIVAM